MICFLNCINQVNGGVLTYAVCQSGCNMATMACYGAAGVVFGVGSVPICNVQQGICMAACAAMTIVPIP